MAYAKLAELPVQFGLYSSFMGVLLYWPFGTSKDITIGVSTCPIYSPSGTSDICLACCSNVHSDRNHRSRRRQNSPRCPWTRDRFCSCYYRRICHLLYWSHSMRLDRRFHLSCCYLSIYDRFSYQYRRRTGARSPGHTKYHRQQSSSHVPGSR